MKTNPLRRYYDKFTSAERLNLVLTARERGDEAEAFALENACHFADIINYERRVLALAHVATFVVIRLLASQVLAVNMLHRLPDEPAADPDLERKLMSQLERQATIWLAFVAWCRDAGHQARQVLRLAPLVLDDREPAFFVVHQTIDMIESWARDTEGSDTLFPDPGQVQEWYDLFTDLIRPEEIIPQEVREPG
jgi:hypothetical protein